MLSEMKSERIPITMEPSLLERVEDYRFLNRIQSRTAAVRSLIEKGLAESEKEKGEATAS
ncbi:hypothetical protein ShzoTeo12_37190 (plasmid) [Shinella zoogloeoides]|nr:hypothetical protein ShzoTeo12_37190 [Shinella zoogloeoides]